MDKVLVNISKNQNFLEKHLSHHKMCQWIIHDQNHIIQTGFQLLTNKQTAKLQACLKMIL
jgi:hypothetical protein